MAAARTVIVIGSNCFTGSHLVDALLEDPRNAVVGISRSPEKGPLYLPYKHRPTARFRFHQIDLVRESERLLALLDDLEPDCVVNVAALSEVNLSNFQPVEYFQTNCLGAVRLGNHLRARSYLRRYVHISSAEIYGSCQGPITESAPLHPSTPYAASKAAADMYLLTLRRNFDFPVTLVRSTNVYGRHQQLFKIIPRAVIRLKQGRAIELHGGGTSVKMFVHIRDVARGVVRIIDADAGTPIYHLSTDNEHTIAEVVGMVCRLMGRDPALAVVSAGDRVAQDSRYWLDCSLAATELGWKPEIPFEQGLKEVIAWVEERWEQILREPHEYVHTV